MSAIALQNIRKTYGSVEVIHSASLEIESGEFIVLVGPSGCGKSTLLRMVAGLEDISGGELFIAGKPVGHLPPAERNIAMVFQDYALYPHMSVKENMGFGLKMRDTAAAEIDNQVGQAADILKLDELLERKPAQLSGGQRQRVAMGRAIVRHPDAFLFDEPLSNLDAALRVEMRLEIARLHRRMRATTLYVTHDQVEAMTLADRIVVMNKGHMEQVGAPMDLYLRPETLFVARFIGSPTMNTPTLKARPAAGDGISIALPGESLTLPVSRRLSGSEVVFGIRPEDLLVVDGADATGWFSGEISMVERLGSQTFGYLDTEIGMITVQFPRGSTVATGDRVSVAGDPAHVHLFDPQSGQRLS